MKSCKQKTTVENAVALSQAESQGPAESRFTSFGSSVYEAKLLAPLRAVLSDKSLKKKWRVSLVRHCLGTKGHSEKSLRCKGGVTF